ncbi:hypothetical protein [Streptomyces tubercidicus]|uniref:hypothetical protein n=1 Tax=Streptomyces tubercidicus TaxID=47759 RepID=UPI003467C82D
MTSKNNLPLYISFTEGAQLLVDRNLVSSMTPQGLRYIARSRADEWPFGEGRTKSGKKRTPYFMASGTRMMPTEEFLAYFEKKPPRGRGPNKKPRGSR